MHSSLRRRGPRPRSESEAVEANVLCTSRLPDRASPGLCRKVATRRGVLTVSCARRGGSRAENARLQLDDSDLSESLNSSEYPALSIVQHFDAHLMWCQ